MVKYRKIGFLIGGGDGEIPVFRLSSGVSRFLCVWLDSVELSLPVQDSRNLGQYWNFTM